MKVFLYLSTPGGLTGAPRRILTLCQAVSRQGVEPYVVGDPDTELYQEAQRLGIKTVSLKTSSILRERNRQLLKGGFLRRARVMLELIVHNISFLKSVFDHRPDAIWFRSSKTFAFAGLGALISRRPLVWDVDYEVPSRGMVGALQKYALRISEKVILQYPDAEKKIFQPEDIQSNSGKFIASIPGIRLEPLDHYARDRQLYFRRDATDFRVLHVGTICDRKNQLLTLEALGQLRKSYPGLWSTRHIVLLFAGGVHETDYKSVVDKRVSELNLQDHVQFLGWQNEIPRLMAHADLLVLPSKDEGVPNTVQEAMYIGCPVAVGNAGGMPAVVEHGKTGWVLPVDDHAPWADVIASNLITSCKVEEIVSNARAYARDHFDDDAWAQGYSLTLKQLVQPC